MATRNYFLSQRLVHVAFASLLSYACLAGGVGCSGKTVDLGANSNRSDANSGPVYSNVGGAHDLVRIIDHERYGCGWGEISATQYVVDAGNLYWLAIDVSSGTLNYILRSCAVDNCAGSVKELSSMKGFGFGCAGGVAANTMQVDRDTVLWHPEDSMLLTSSRWAPSEAARVSVEELWHDYDGYLLSDGKLYNAALDGTLMQCDVDDCASSAVRYPLSSVDGQSPIASKPIAQDRDYLYLERFLQSLSLQLVRVAKDPSVAFDVVLSTLPTAPGAITAHGDNLYWVENVPMGQLLSCPKSGCQGNPTVLTTGLAQPTGLVADDQYLYILEQPQISTETMTPTRPGRILRCPLSGCDEPTVLYSGGLNLFMDQLSVDERFVYFLGTDCTPEQTQLASPCGFIGAVPK